LLIDERWNRVGTLNFKTIFESLPVSYLVLDPEYRVVAMTRTAAQRSPKPASDLVGKSVRELLALQGIDSTNTSPIEAPVYAEDGSLEFIIYCGEKFTQASSLKPAMSAVGHQNDVTYEDLASVLPKDEYRWPDAQADLNRDDSGHPPRITGHQFDNIERKSAQEALLETESNLRSALKMGNIGLWNWDLVTNKITFSDEWKQQIGYAADEIQDNFESWSTRVHPDDIGTALQKLRSTINDPLVRYESEFRFRHKDGSYRWIHAEGDCLRNEDGQTLSMCGCHLDITRSKSKQSNCAIANQTYGFR
jgi:PAS domain S-box-containing protein